MLTELLSKFSGLCLMVFIAVYGDFTLLRPDASDLEKSSVSLFFFGVHSPVTNYLPTSKMVSYRKVINYCKLIQTSKQYSSAMKTSNSQFLFSKGFNNRFYCSFNAP